MRTRELAIGAWVSWMIGSGGLVMGCSGPNVVDAGQPDVPADDVPAADAPETDAPVIDVGGSDTGVDTPPSCPALSGSWLAMVEACGTTVVPTQVTVDLDAACAATFTSIAPKGDPPVNGTVTLAADGSFGPADLTIGAETLSCTGTLDAAVDPPSYEIACVGGCTITLTPEP